MNPVILWFRRNLRLHDNLALNAAAESGRPVVPVYISDQLDIFTFLVQPCLSIFLRFVRLDLHFFSFPSSPFSLIISFPALRLGYFSH